MRCDLLQSLLLALIFVRGLSATLLGSYRIEKRTNTSSSVAPIVVPPSQYWDGIDGRWSSVALRVGSPAQEVRAIVSTNSPQTFVVLPSGCDAIAFQPSTVPATCASSRGGLFNPNMSTSWRDQGLFGINGGGIGFEANLGYSQNADYGLESVGLGFSASGTDTPTLQNQTVSAIASTAPLYFGLFGLGTQPVNYSSIGNFSAPSYFSSLIAQNLIPSLSWSYTAGAQYRLKAGQYAQLIFGGYDTSRFSQNSVNFNLASDIDRDIVVGVQSILYSGATQAQLLPSPIYAFIDSTDPNFWLPEEACQAFEKAFGISVDNSTGLYLINETQYTVLHTTNPTVTFSLANSEDGGEFVDIALPFNSFALSASYPFVPNATYYFPLKKAANESQYTLGRTFLQEAYLTVDYERGNFSVSQCLWNDGAPSQIMTIPSLKDDTPNLNGNKSGAQPPRKKVSIGAIVGGIAAGVVFLATVGALVYFYLRRRRSSQVVELVLATPTIALDTIVSPHTDDWARDSLPPDTKPESELDLHVLRHQRSELSGISDIHKTKEKESAREVYEVEAGDARAILTPELPGSGFRFELDAGPVPRMANHAPSRNILSSPVDTFSSQRTESTTGPFDLALPISDSPQAVERMRSQNQSPTQSEPLSWLAITPTSSIRRPADTGVQSVPVSPEPSFDWTGSSSPRGSPQTFNTRYQRR